MDIAGVLWSSKRYADCTGLYRWRMDLHDRLLGTGKPRRRGGTAGDCGQVFDEWCLSWTRLRGAVHPWTGRVPPAGTEGVAGDSH